MKVIYEKPEIKVLKFDVEGKIMAHIDNGNGDAFENPWLDEASGGEPSGQGLE